MLANVYSLLGRHEKARDIHDRLLASARINEKDPQRLATALNDLAIDYRHLGQYEEAIRLFAESRDLSRNSGDKEGEARALYNMGMLYSVNGDTEKAIDVVRRAADLSREVGSLFGQGMTHDALGQMYLAVGNLEEARTHQLRAISFNAAARQVYGEVGSVGALGVVERMSGRLEESERHLRRAVQLASTSGLAEPAVEFRIELALTLLKQERTQEALALVDEAQALAQQHNEAQMLFRARSARAEVVEALGQLEEAATLYGQSIDALESWRGRLDYAELSLSVADRYSSIFEGAIRCLLALGRTAEAFEVSERAKARALLHAMTARKQNAPLVRQQLVPLATVPEIQQQLLRNPASALLAFYWGERDVYAWKIDSTGIQGSNLGDAGSLASTAEFLRLGVSDAQNELDWRPAARAAHARLVAPLAANTPQQLIVIADGPLARLPFEVFMASDESGVPLGMTSRILYGPSASVLVELDRRPLKRASRAVLALGYSPAPGGTRPPLQYAPVEARAIARLFSADGAVEVTGARATRQAWLRADPGAYRILHLATHATIDDFNPRNSHLLFADGHLDIDTIRELRLNADLVTLSACDTALGRSYRGEGLVGFSHAFLAAGAQSLVVSHWPVADEPAAEFMTSFYRRLRRGESAEASLLELRKEWWRGRGYKAHPAAWAAFVIVGSPRRHPA
jgi:CHAT domain-containing protein